MTTAPTLSVLMPVYNAQPHLTAAIDSILKQTFGDFELILMDDGSTDGSEDVMEAAARQDRRVRVQRFEHQGYARLLSWGLAQARAEVIARMDADDVAMPQRFEKQLAYLQQNPQVEVLGTAYRVLLGDEQSPFVQVNPTSPGEVDQLMPRGCCVGHPTVMLRKAALLEAGGYRTAFLPAEDHDLWLRLLSGRKGVIANLGEPLLWYRIHPQQISTRKVFQSMIASQAAILAYQLREAGKADPFDGVKEITYELLVSLWPDVGELNANLIAGYCLRIAQQEAWGFGRGQLEPLYEGMWSFAGSHGLTRYARARLGVALAMQPGLSPLRRAGRWTQALWAGARSAVFQRQVLGRLRGQ